MPIRNSLYVGKRRPPHHPQDANFDLLGGITGALGGLFGNQPSGGANDAITAQIAAQSAQFQQAQQQRMIDEQLKEHQLELEKEKSADTRKNVTTYVMYGISGIVVLVIIFVLLKMLKK